MGSSGSGAVDCSVGSIVWVRRRNGSWWPGKILGPEELAASHLTSPRSGTPVKLLGREDASVDWYNLEKSKRVKAFRCGEFDDCIERAESSQGMPIKKREKYARREDAILHALELEKELLRKQGKLAPELERSKSTALSKELVAFSGELDMNNGKPENSRSNQILNRQDMSGKDDNIGSSLYSPKAQGGGRPSCEDDHSEVVPRMRGLQDFGLRTAPSKRKLMSSGTSDGSTKPLADSNSQASSSGDLSMGRASHANGEEQTGGILRAKRSRSGHVPPDSNNDLDDKEIPNSQMEILSSQFDTGDCHPHPPITEENAEFVEDVESGSSESDSSESDSDSSETEVDMDEEMVALTGASGPTEADLNALGRHAAVEDESMSSEEHDESSLSGDISHLYRHDPVSNNEAVSKWQLKGKRNVRNLTRRSVDNADGKTFNGSVSGTYNEGKGTGLNQRLWSFGGNDGVSDGINEADFSEKNYGIQMVGLGGGGCLRTSRTASRSRNSYGSMIDWEDGWEDYTAMKRHWDPMFVGRRPLAARTRSMLIDVDVKVQASYQKEPVPIVSLMSKLNGKAIIGHPIQIEPIADGSSDNLLSASDYFGEDTAHHDGNAALPSARRTARRANSRVPRPHLSSTFEDDEAAEDHSFIFQERKPSFKKLSVGSFGYKASMVRKSLPHIPRPPADRKFQRKLPKKASLSSNQKTRTLASIGIEQNHRMKPIHHGSNCQMEMKPESSGPPTVACIPVKLVYSRLLEKINRPPSKAAGKVVLLSSDAGRDES